MNLPDRRARLARRLFPMAVATAALCACASHHKPPPIGPTAPPAQTYRREGPAEPVAPTQGAPIPGSERDFVINVGDRVYFDFDQSQIRADAAPVLSAQATWLVRYPGVAVRIEGNCDERGTREYNFALGARRASAVRQFLIAHGVNGARIAIISYGKERPIDPGTGGEAEAKDRNAHTAIVSGAVPSS